MSVRVASLYAEIGADTSGLKRGLDETKTGMSDVTSRLNSLGVAASNIGRAMTIGLTLPVVAGFGMMIDKASDLSETINKVDVVFGDSADAVLQFGQNAAQSLGMSEQKAMEAAGTFGNLFTSMGIGIDTSADMSTSLLTLAADLASFNNIDPTVALEKLRAGLVGEVEPLRTLGVNLSAATVELKAMELGLIAEGEEMTAAAKSQAAYALIMEQTTNAQGDFARTADGLANSTRIAKAELADAAAEMGQHLLPIALDAVQTISGLVEKFSDMEPAGQKAILTVAGIAAAMGPLLLVVGKVITILPTLQAGFAALHTAALGPIGIAVAALAAGFIALGIAMDSEQDRMDEATHSVLGFDDALKNHIITENEYKGVTMALMNGQWDAQKAQEWLATKTREYTGAVEEASIAVVELTRGDEIMTERHREGADAAREHAAGLLEISDAANDVESTAPALVSAIRDIAGGFDEAGAAGDLFRQGLNLISDSMVDQQRIALVLEIATGNLTAAEIEERLNQLDRLAAMEELNEALEDGAITHYQWIAAMADGTVTQDEVNRLLGVTSEQISDIERQVLSVQGSYDIEFNVSVTGDAIPALPSSSYTGAVAYASGTGGEWMTVPPGYENDTYPIVLSSGEKYAVAKPGEELPGGGGGGDTYYVTLQVGSNPDGIELYRQFRQALDSDLRAADRGGVQTSDY